ncbi:hypothetical protein [Amazonocrinis nigriterrae]|nr:hypothetical protein [Amazonocrinis nigriterrae]
MGRLSTSSISPLLDKDVAVYQDILRILIIFGGGFGSGMGFQKYLDRKNK